ncbi:AraC family transcriptional regulator [Paenibacillus sp. JCM 10914]|uniref:AraC family transcriptional regulator n=1 Tax=Paenibacillus sp. JCM 10914 TaxID=1236974 RepID=UPI0003CC903D|nr:AraC family transcriptional regulator [Paenibacillus sp. JCM 10914]GAE07265.1 helix-turn-helix, AraC type [Paenibacillus sp. JCM 10914]
MEQFTYKKASGITALSASLTDFKYKKHYHEEYALGVTLRGIQKYVLDGSQQVSCQSGVMLFHPEQNHDGWSHERSGIDYVMIYIHPDLFLEMIGKPDIVRFQSPVVYHEGLRNSILNVTKAVFTGQPEALCHERLLGLAAHFNEDILNPATQSDNSFTLKAKELMHDHLDHVLKLDELSEAFGMSKFQFIRSFKANTGLSPYQYYLNCKVERAKQLIEGSRDVYQAVAECGFTDLAHLNRHFKNTYGTTAYDYMSHLSN